MRMYDDVEYARTRLNETIVRLNDEPILVLNIDGRQNVMYQLLSNDVQGQCKLKDLNIDPVKLGYLNHKKGTNYLTRTPMRRDWKQGLRNTSLRDQTGMVLHTSNAELANVIKGIYPRLKECFSKNTNPFEEGAKCTIKAFSRNFAVDNSNDNLLFKGRWTVGEIHTDKSYKLLPKFDWVVDMLEEELNAA